MGGRAEVRALRRQNAHWRKYVRTGRNTYVVLAKKGAEIAAFAYVFRKKAAGGWEDFINLVEVIDPADRGQGIGSALVARVIETARKSGSCQVRAYFDKSNTASRQLWLKNGFALMPEGPGFFAIYTL